MLNELAIVLRSTLFALGMWLSLAVYAPVMLVATLSPVPLRYRLLATWAPLILRWLRFTCGLDYRVEGLENLPEGNCVVLSKHQSAWETLALQEIFPNPCWVLKRELLWVPLFGWGLALTQPIAIDRKAGRKAMHQVLQQGRQRLAEGRWVVVFPEGTRVAPGQRRQYSIGGAMLAEKSGYPVIPVAHNAGEFWPRRGFLKRPGTVALVIGPPIASSGRRATEINTLAESWIEATMLRLSPTADPGNGG